MSQKDYGPLIDEKSARSDRLGSNNGFPSRGNGQSGIQMSDNVGGSPQRPSQRVGRFQNQNDIDRISAPPQSSVYQQVRTGDDSMMMSGLKARTIKFNNFNFVLRGIPNNKINNQRYSILSFVPIVLFDQFKYFFNLFFLLVCLSQFFEPLRVGFLISYLAPLLFVLAVTMIKEFYEDYKRGERDKQLNRRKYKRLDCHSGIIREVMAQDIRVGDIVQVNANERVPADMVCLYTTDKSGTAYVRTD